MKCIWKIPNINNMDEGIDNCPSCHSTLVTFDSRRMLCPSCAALEIDRLRKEVKRLTRRAAERQKAGAKKSQSQAGKSLRAVPLTQTLDRLGEKMKFIECECCGFLAAIPETDSHDIVCPFCHKSECSEGKFLLISEHVFINKCGLTKR